MNKLMKKSKKGFTLMEMLIVVAIIAILVVIAIPTFTNALTEARENTDMANARAYYAECVMNGMLNDGVITPGTAPTCQVSGRTIVANGTALEGFTVSYMDGTTEVAVFPQN